MPNPAILPDLAALAAALTRDPTCPSALGALAPGDLVPMREKGVAHAHFLLPKHGLVLRVPRLSQWALAPAENLAYQAACFRRAEPSGATPRLHAVFATADDLPRGALLVEAIAGRAPRLPDDLPALATALARLHALPLPAPAARAPLADHSRGGAIAGTLVVIERQVPALDGPDMPSATRHALLEELAWARRFAGEAASSAEPVALVGTDTHPGNFIIRDDGSAVLVDLEKALYGAPAIDLAHCTLLTSTSWDLDVQVMLSRDETVAFYRCYLALCGPAGASLRPFLIPCRRLTWLRTMMWCARWRVAAATSAEWSQERIDPALLAHIRRRVATFFRPESVAAARAEWLGEPPLEF